MAPKPTVKLPRIHYADVRLTAAEAEIAASNLIPLVGDVAALGFDLLGTPFAVITASSFAGDLAISDLSSGLLGDIPGDLFNSLQFGIGSRLSLLSADIGVLTDEVNHLTGILNPAPSSTSAAASADRAAAVDPLAIGALTGDAALLGLDVTATPFELAESLTNALSAAALDLGAGQLQAAAQDFATNLRLGLVEAQTRLGNDLNGIAASVARLTGAPASAPVVAAKTGAPQSAAQAISAPTAKPAGAAQRAVTVSKPAPTNASATTGVSTRHSAETAGDTKSIARQHSAPVKQHASTAKHRKH